MAQITDKQREYKRRRQSNPIHIKVERPAYLRLPDGSRTSHLVEAFGEDGQIYWVEIELDWRHLLKHVPPLVGAIRERIISEAAMEKAMAGMTL